MWSSLLVFLQIFKVFLDLWKEKDNKKAQQKADTAKEIVDAFATVDPAQKASVINDLISSIRLHGK